MKKKVLVLFVLLLCVVLVGCSFKKTGETYTIKLHDNSSSGRFWEYELDKEDIVELTTNVDYSGCGDNDGCSGVRIYKLKALKAGTVTLSLKCYTHDDSVDDEITYTIIVDKDLKITASYIGDEEGYVIKNN